MEYRGDNAEEGLEQVENIEDARIPAQSPRGARTVLYLVLEQGHVVKGRRTDVEEFGLDEPLLLGDVFKRFRDRR